MGLRFFVQAFAWRCFYLIHTRCEVTCSFTNKSVTSGSILWWSLWTFPCLCPLLLAKSQTFKPNVKRLRHCEVPADPSSLSLPEVRRTRCAAGGAAPFQDLRNKIFSKLLGKRGQCWGIALATQHPSTSWSSPMLWRINTVLCFRPPLPKADDDDPLAWEVAPYPRTARDQDLNKTILILFLLWRRHKEIQTTLCPTLAPELTRCERCGAGGALVAEQPAGTAAVETVIQINRWNLTRMLKRFHKLKPIWATAQRTTLKALP